MTKSHRPLGKEIPILSMSWHWKAGHFPKSPSSSRVPNLNWLFWSDSCCSQVKVESGTAGKSWLHGYLESPPAKPLIFLCKNDITDLMPELSPSSCPCLKQRCLRAIRILGWGRHQLPLQKDTACCRHFVPVFPWKSSSIQLSVLQAHKSCTVKGLAHPEKRRLWGTFFFPTMP